MSAPGKRVLVLEDVQPGFGVGFAKKPDPLVLEFSDFFKGDPGITGLREVVITDAFGEVIATLLTGEIEP